MKINDILSNEFTKQQATEAKLEIIKQTKQKGIKLTENGRVLAITSF